MTEGYENDPTIAMLAQRNVNESAAKNLISIYHADASGAKLQHATVIFIFLPADIVSEIIGSLLPRVMPGTRIIAHEQEALICDPPPDRSKIIVAKTILTVAHLWIKRGPAEAPGKPIAENM